MQDLFTELGPLEINSNVFDLIGNKWMLITAGDSSRYNTMTASWGGLGVLWNKTVSFIFVRPQRFTFEFTEKYAYYTLCFFDEEYRKILSYCGTHSGRNVDKIKETGLKPVFTELGNVCFEQAGLVFECRKLYTDFIKENSFIDIELRDSIYSKKDYHKFYMGIIENCYQKKEV